MASSSVGAGGRGTSATAKAATAQARAAETAAGQFAGLSPLARTGVAKHAASMAAAAQQAAEEASGPLTGLVPKLPAALAAAKARPPQRVRMLTAIRPLREYTPLQLRWFQDRFSQGTTTVGGMWPVQGGVQQLVDLHCYSSRITDDDRTEFLKAQADHYRHLSTIAAVTAAATAAARRGVGALSPQMRAAISHSARGTASAMKAAALMTTADTSSSSTNTTTNKKRKAKTTTPKNKFSRLGDTLTSPLRGGAASPKNNGKKATPLSAAAKRREAARLKKKVAFDEAEKWRVKREQMVRELKQFTAKGKKVGGNKGAAAVAVGKQAGAVRGGGGGSGVQPGGGATSAAGGPSAPASGSGSGSGATSKAPATTSVANGNATSGSVSPKGKQIASGPVTSKAAAPVNTS